MAIVGHGGRLRLRFASCTCLCARPSTHTDTLKPRCLCSPGSSKPRAFWHKLPLLPRCRPGAPACSPSYQASKPQSPATRVPVLSCIALSNHAGSRCVFDIPLRQGEAEWVRVSSGCPWWSSHPAWAAVTS